MTLYSEPRLLLENNREILGIPTGIKGKSFALTKLSALKNEKGWIVGQDDITEWKVDGFLVREGEIFLYGHKFSGRSLGAILEHSKPKSSISVLSLLIGALKRLNSHGAEPFHIQSDSVIISDEGNILFLPPNLMKNVDSTRPLHYRIKVYDRYNNPSLQGEKSLSFTLGVIAYKFLTGEYPFDSETEEELHEKMRSQDLLPPRLIIPEINEEVSSFIMQSLGRDNESGKCSNLAEIPDLSQWETKLEQWGKGSIYLKISEDEKTAVIQQAESRRVKINKDFKRKVFWQRNWKKIAIISLAVIISGAVLGSIMKNVLAPRKTHGFTPIEVVKTFYNSMNTLDSQIISDCVIDKAGKQEVDEVTNLFVISRVSLGYEGKTSIISAPEWDKRGRPELKPPLSVYGVLNLKIETVRPVPRPVFLVNYQKWVPVSQGENPDKTNTSVNKGRAYQGFEITDKLYLKKDRGDWVIHKIERLKREPVNQANTKKE